MAGTVANRRADRRTSTVQGKVLVIDDEADIRELLELSLVRMGLGVESVGSVAEAQSLLQSKRYDLCLTDMRLPDGDGLDLVRFIGVQCADLPVAVITAFGSTENAVAALKAGAFDYLTKPLSLDQLRALVKSALSLPQARGSQCGSRSSWARAPDPSRCAPSSKTCAQPSAWPHHGRIRGGKELAARLIHGKGSRRELSCR
jgi:two-component system response regulator PilR (NtrC family)